MANMFVDKTHKKPLVAKTDISIYLPINSYTENSISFLQNSSFLSNRVLPRKTVIDLESPIEITKSPNFKSPVYNISNGIYLNLWPQNPSMGLWFRGYIPAGTRYWLNLTSSSVMAEKVVFTDPVLDGYTGLDLNLSVKLYKNAEKIQPYSRDSYIRVGDFMVETLGGKNIYVSPYAFSEISNYKIKGIVVGFDLSEIPLVADIFNVPNSGLQLVARSYLPAEFRHSSSLEQAKEDFNGWINTSMLEDQIEGSRLAVKSYISSLGPTHYLPAFGELITFFRNIPYIAAACSIARVQMPNLEGWHWSSTEASTRRNTWASTLTPTGRADSSFPKSLMLRVIPFIASSTFLNLI